MDGWECSSYAVGEGKVKVRLMGELDLDGKDEKFRPSSLCKIQRTFLAFLPGRWSHKREGTNLVLLLDVVAHGSVGC